MPHSPRVAVIGDYNDQDQKHLATTAELVAAGARATWVATEAVGDPAQSLADVDALFIATGPPYVDMEGALRAIRYAREHRVPLIGTCSGYQHVVVEFVRNVLGVADAGHAESQPDAERLAVTPLVCLVAGQRLPVLPVAGTRAAAIYEAASVIEPYYCNYGLNPEYEQQIEAAGLRVSGRDEDGRARILELAGHPFFLATLYVFQARDDHAVPHPITRAFLAAARARRIERAERT